ncbi:amidohydrolase family protein [Nocardia sp. NPDC057353]|uniref:amidohydrolase family protein n=1 Tax=Nocardia sp. NPDC057353 TaxID=3346104 RepID=UPI00363A6B87
MRLAGTELGDFRVLDAHIHQWDPLGTPRDFSSLAKLFKYLPVPIDIAVRVAKKRDREFVGDPTAYTKPYLPADYRADAGELPVAGIVHIEVDWHASAPLGKADETRWVQSLPFGVDTPALAALIGSADPAAPGFTDLLDAHASASPVLRGIRTMVANHPDPDVRSFTPAPDSLATPAFLDGFAALAERGLGFEAWVYSHQIPQVTAVAQRYPEVPVVLNHLGTPAGIFGRLGSRTGADAGARRDLLLRWRDDTAALAALPNVVAKVSGLGMPVLGHPVPKRGTTTPVDALVDRFGPLLTHAHSVFGAERLIWGSNFPVDKPITTIPGSAEAVALVLAESGCDAEQLRAVFGGNARRVYRIAD